MKQDRTQPLSHRRTWSVICGIFSVIIVSSSVFTGSAIATDEPKSGSSTASHSFLVEWTDSSRSRVVPVKIFVPSSGDHWPIIFFSHGLGGSRMGYGHYGEAWSKAGFVCVHLEHEGSDTDVMQKGAGLQNMKKLEAAAADPRNALNRAKDVSFAIDQMIEVNANGGAGDLAALKGKLNTKKIGMAGHSFGANTTMMVAGLQSAFRQLSNASLKDTRITAAIAMSTPVNRIDAETLDRMYADVDIPILHFTGTKDSSPIDTQPPEARQLPFEHCPQPDQILVVFNDGDHGVFAASPNADDSRRKILSRLRATSNYGTIQPIVMETTLKFWNRWLLDDASAETWLRKDLKAFVGSTGTVKYKTDEKASR